jgi:RNA polymerase sigma factor (sigma-70 family)
MKNNGSGVTALLNSYTRFPVPTASEEIHLGNQVRTWLDWPEGNPPKGIVRAGKKAKRTLFERNLRLVVHCARKYKHSLSLNEHEFEDAIQNGCLGLNRAIEKFSPDRGYKFSTYAFWWLRQSIIRGDGQRRMVRIPDQALQEYKNLSQAITELREQNIKPTPEILSEMTGLNEYKIAQRAEIGKMKIVSSLDQKVGKEGTPLIELIADRNSDNPDLELELSELENLLTACMVLLDSKEALVVQRKLEGVEHKDICEELSVSRARVAQLWREARLKLAGQHESHRVGVV